MNKYQSFQLPRLSVEGGHCEPAQELTNEQTAQ
jgi:hypothetical protein